ncbi:hypothetical protein UFOVP1324_34 [uncultured Caudovirales phage]|uniref:Uncharacterized protein n=1 Tax=uncultured Caudovirales phage TaxID=2100421 RepID=A0A6J5RWU7_9CAUD|nr:hypothetical protein UFOVP1324_34 [uncultured Caudovirales phage]
MPGTLSTERHTMDDQHQNDADGEQVRGLPVKGYKSTQPEWAIEAVNAFKELEERTLRAAESLDGQAVDHRLLAIGKTQLQGAFMFLARAIFQPQRVELAEDTQRELI